ncbi:hypothetical protein AVEN_84643-1 [Araneus ventricosus]|uniref:Uncharacterized protein n=1 Tax=Araneus ventricosus TaxID=182803 RepID=A0A4Y2HK16_ARAVE|nr:hypothetical protein AVEN_84643-1 [Araneus ventricosus]
MRCSTQVEKEASQHPQHRNFPHSHQPIYLVTGWLREIPARADLAADLPLATGQPTSYDSPCRPPGISHAMQPPPRRTAGTERSTSEYLRSLTGMPGDPPRWAGGNPFVPGWINGSSDKWTSAR